LRVLSARAAARNNSASSLTFPGAWFRLGANQELHLIGDRADPVSSHTAATISRCKWKTSTRGSGTLTHSKWNTCAQGCPDGASQLFIRDPDGHVIELFTPPQARRLNAYGIGTDAPPLSPAASTGGEINCR